MYLVTSMVLQLPVEARSQVKWPPLCSTASWWVTQHCSQPPSHSCAISTMPQHSQHWLPVQYSPTHSWQHSHLRSLGLRLYSRGELYQHHASACPPQGSIWAAILWIWFHLQHGLRCKRNVIQSVHIKQIIMRKVIYAINVMFANCLSYFFSITYFLVYFVICHSLSVAFWYAAGFWCDFLWLHLHLSSASHFIAT